MAAVLIIAGIALAGTAVLGWAICRVAAWADERMELVNLDAELDRMHDAGEVDQ